MKKKIVSTKYAGTKISIKRERGKIIFRKEPLNNMIFSNVIIWYSSNFFLLKAENVSPSTKTDTMRKMTKKRMKLKRLNMSQLQKKKEVSK